MKVLHVVHGLPPQEIGGVEVDTMHQVLALRELDHKIYIFARSSNIKNPEFSISDYDADGLTIRRVVRTLRTLGSPLAYFNQEIDRSFEDFVKKVSPDVVHIQHLIGLSTGIARIVKMLDLPLVISLHDFWYACERVHLLRPDNTRCEGPEQGKACALHCYKDQSLFLRFHDVFNTLRYATLFIAYSKFTKRKYVEWGLPEEKIKVIHPGIPRSSEVNKLPQGQPLRLGYVGSIIPDKGIDLLIEAVNCLPQHLVSLRIYGDMQHAPLGYVSYLRRMARSANRDIMFMGPFDLSQENEIYQEIDVLVLPSRRYEGFGLVVREAWRRGIPVIVSSGGALEEAVATGAAIAFQEGDSEHLAFTIKSLLDNPQQLRQLASAARSLDIPDPLAAAKEIEKVYQEAREVALRTVERQKAKDTPTLSVCIVGYNSWNHLAVCLPSLLAAIADLPAEVILVDNASADGTVHRVLQEFPNVRVIANSENKGFAFATNQALRASQGEFLLLLNPDTRVFPGTIEHCIDYLRNNHQIGAVGCKLIGEDGSSQISAARFWRPSDLFILYGFLGVLLRRLNPAFDPVANVQYPAEPDSQEVDYVIGAFMLTTRDVLTHVGMLDEDYFVGTEDIDWCLKLRQHGYKVQYLQNIAIAHVGASTAPLYDRYRTRLMNDCLFLQKHYGFFGNFAAKYLWIAGRLRRHFEREIVGGRNVIFNYIVGGIVAALCSAFEIILGKILNPIHRKIVDFHRTRRETPGEG